MRPDLADKNAQLLVTPGKGRLSPSGLVFRMPRYSPNFPMPITPLRPMI